MASGIAPALTARHDEVVDALRAIGNAEYGRHVQVDRGSQLEHLGVRFPALQKRVKQGFSFYRLPGDEVLETWDALWRTSPYGEVLFAALEYYIPLAKKGSVPGLWDVARGWIDRVDNWCHSDKLSMLYSHLLAADVDTVYPQMVAWNGAADEWRRRISIVSLIRYSGKNAVFLPPDRVLPLVANCVDDHRYYVGLVVGWVLREIGSVYPGEVDAFLDEHGTAMSARLFARDRAAAGRRERTVAGVARSLMKGLCPPPIPYNAWK